MNNRQHTGFSLKAKHIKARRETLTASAEWDGSAWVVSLIVYNAATNSTHTSSVTLCRTKYAAQRQARQAVSDYIALVTTDN
jgi:hypothetical protein